MQRSRHTTVAALASTSMACALKSTRARLFIRKGNETNSANLLAGTMSYPATLFTDAPLHVLQRAIAVVAASGAPLPEPPPLRPLLSLRDLRYSTADGWPCARGLRFDLPPGAAVLVQGPSGCGKSTLVRVLAGLHPAQSGTFQLPPRDEVRFVCAL